jgi:16S rRNA (guanine966-N2)-methyltransferase
MRIIAGTHKNRALATPKGLQTRPTASKLRQALFNICQGYIQEALFLDLFAGSGAMGLEALSRGAQKAVFVDSNKEAVKCIYTNLKEFNMEERAEVVSGDVFRAIDQLIKKGYQFDIIYADPPYEKRDMHDALTYGEKVIRKIDEQNLLKSGGSLFVEDAGNAIEDIQGLKSLSLSSERKLGRSVLLHYEEL